MSFLQDAEARRRLQTQLMSIVNMRRDNQDEVLLWAEAERVAKKNKLNAEKKGKELGELETIIRSEVKDAVRDAISRSAKRSATEPAAVHYQPPTPQQSTKTWTPYGGGWGHGDNDGTASSIEKDPYRPYNDSSFDLTSHRTSSEKEDDEETGDEGEASSSRIGPPPTRSAPTWKRTSNAVSGSIDPPATADGFLMNSQRSSGWLAFSARPSSTTTGSPPSPKFTPTTSDMRSGFSPLPSFLPPRALPPPPNFVPPSGLSPTPNFTPGRELLKNQGVVQSSPSTPGLPDTKGLSPTKTLPPTQPVRSAPGVPDPQTFHMAPAHLEPWSTIVVRNGTYYELRCPDCGANAGRSAKNSGELAYFRGCNGMATHMRQMHSDKYGRPTWRLAFSHGAKLLSPERLAALQEALRTGDESRFAIRLIAAPRLPRRRTVSKMSTSVASP